MLTALIGPVTGLLDKFIEDKDQKNRLAHDIATMSEKHANVLMKEQAKANTEAAKHPSMFVAGARPAIMWVCAIGLMVNFFLLPIMTWFTALFAPEICMPNFVDTGELISLTIALLGMGGLRSFEKSKGVARENMKK